MKNLISMFDERTVKMIEVLIITILVFLAMASLCLFVQRLTDVVWNLHDFKAHLDSVAFGLY